MSRIFICLFPGLLSQQLGLCPSVVLFPPLFGGGGGGRVPLLKYTKKKRVGTLILTSILEDLVDGIFQAYEYITPKATDQF